jgi:hypothetical protein
MKIGVEAETSLVAPIGNDMLLPDLLGGAV